MYDAKFPDGLLVIAERARKCLRLLRCLGKTVSIVRVITIGGGIT
jgi:hypothetical protein